VKNILLIGHYGFVNRGCEAIVRCTVDIIRKYISDCHITLLSSHCEEDRKVILEKHIPVDEIFSSFGEERKLSPGWMWQTFDRRVLSFNMPYYDYINWPRYKKSDIILSVGGDNLAGDYKGTDTVYQSLRYAKKAGAKTVVWAASIGPFKETQRTKFRADILKNVDLITVREKDSQEFLRSLGVIDNVKLVADPAFLLNKSKPAGFNLSINGGKMLVGIGMSSLISNYGLDRHKYTNAFAEFITSLWKKEDARFILVPHVTETDSINNDMAACESLRSLLPAECPIQTLDKNLDACEMKYFIAQCDYFIGARTHSTIASMSSGIPTASIAYSSKAWGINKLLFDSDEYVLPIGDVTKDKLTGLFEKMRKNKDNIKSKLTTRISEIRSMSEMGGRYLQELAVENK
jgi:polysaccharide pyruvyl transferase WcaK-like protein